MKKRRKKGVKNINLNAKILGSKRFAAILRQTKFFIVPRKNLFRAWRTKSCDAAISKKGEKTKANALGNAFAYVRCFDVRFGNARAVRHGALVVVIFDAYQR